MCAQKVGIIGSGNIGGNLGLHLAQAGYPVMFSSRHPETLTSLAEQAQGEARVGTIQEAAAFGEIIVISVPYQAVEGLSREIADHVKGKIIIDTTNPYPGRDGDMAQRVRDSHRGATEFVAEFFPQSYVLKAFNTIYYKNLQSKAFMPAGQRFALPYAGDHQPAVQTLAKLIEDIGFGGLYVGKLSESKLMDPDQPLYAKELSVEEAQQLLNQHRA